MTDKPPTTDEARVRELLTQYGAEPSRFPAAERSAATALLQSSPELQSLQKQARALDAFLDLSEAAPASMDLMRRVAEIPLRHLQRAQSLWLHRLLGGNLMLRLAAASALAAALGVGSGMWAGRVLQTGSPQAQLSEEAWEDLEMLAFADSLVFEDFSTAEEAP